MTDEQQFRAILGFLGRFGAEVSGRIALDPEFDGRLRLFADGSFAREPKTQDALITAIAGNAEALSRLADHLRR
jgi:hypothetical protein